MMCHDGQAAKDFYTGLFGWTYGDHPAGPDMVYTMFSHNGLAASAPRRKRGRGRGQENLPAHWSVYVTVNDLEAATERARAAGGTVIMEPFDVSPVDGVTVGPNVYRPRQGGSLSAAVVPGGPSRRRRDDGAWGALLV